MIGESTSLFKVFRVLWFPVSINAMVLGAAAVLIFWLGTWLGCLVIGETAMTSTATSGFPKACELALRRTVWPGFATEDVDVGNQKLAQHHLLAIEDPEKISEEDQASAAADIAVIEELFATWREEHLASFEDAEEKRDAARELRTTLPRYRLVFGWQLALFFFLWATFGVAICRVMALRMARDEYCTLSDAFWYAWRIKLTGILYPAAVLLPVGFLVVCNQLAGWVAWIPAVGPLLAIILLPLVLISSILIILMVIVGLVSLGLIPAAIAVERKGTYDSLGKAFNYVFARPLPVILHLVVLWHFLAIIWWIFMSEDLVVQAIGDTMVPIWGDAQDQEMMTGNPEGLDGLKKFGGWIFQALLTAFHILVWGAMVSFVLGAFTSLFLLLRKDVDGMDYIDVARDPAAAPPAPAPPAPEPTAAPATEAEPAASPEDAPAGDEEPPGDEKPPESGTKPAS